jgi:hypothetical protein
MVVELLATTEAQEWEVELPRPLSTWASPLPRVVNGHQGYIQQDEIGGGGGEIKPSPLILKGDTEHGILIQHG